MRGILVPAVAVLLLPALAPAAATDEVLLDARDWAGNGHVAWRVAGPAGAQVRLELHADPGNAGMAGHGFWVLRPDGTVWGGMGMGFGLTEVRAGVQGVDPRLAAEFAGPAWVGFTSTTSVPVLLDGTGDVLVVAASAADGELATTARLFGNGGAQVGGRTTGGAFLHREFDFHGLVSIVAKGIGAQSKLLLDTHLDLPVTGRLFAGWMGDNACGELRVSGDGPAGSFAADVPRADWFYQRYPGTGPGTYHFRIDLNRDAWPCPDAAPGQWPPEVWLAGADVVLP